MTAVRKPNAGPSAPSDLSLQRRVDGYSGAGKQFKVKLVGSEDVIARKGDDYKLSQEAIRRLKQTTKHLKTHKPKLVISLTLNGISVFDDRTKSSSQVPLKKIFYVAHALDDFSYFGIITAANESTTKYKLFAYKAELKIAMEFVASLKEVFSISYKLNKAKKFLKGKQEKAKETTPIENITAPPPSYHSVAQKKLVTEDCTPSLPERHEKPKLPLPTNGCIQVGPVQVQGVQGDWKRCSLPYRKPLPPVPQDTADSVLTTDQNKKGEEDSLLAEGPVDDYVPRVLPARSSSRTSVDGNAVTITTPFPKPAPGGPVKPLPPLPPKNVLPPSFAPVPLPRKTKATEQITNGKNEEETFTKQQNQLERGTKLRTLEGESESTISFTTSNLTSPLIPEANSSQEAIHTTIHGHGDESLSKAAGCHQAFARPSTMANPRSSSLPTNSPLLAQRHFQPRMSLPEMDEKDASLHTSTTSHTKSNRSTSSPTSPASSSKSVDSALSVSKSSRPLPPLPPKPYERPLPITQPKIEGLNLHTTATPSLGNSKILIGATTESSSTKPPPPCEDLPTVANKTTVPEFDLFCFTSFDGLIPFGDAPLPDAATGLEFSADLSTLLPLPDVLPELLVQPDPLSEMLPSGQATDQVDQQDNALQSAANIGITLEPYEDMSGVSRSDTTDMNDMYDIPVAKPENLWKKSHKSATSKSAKSTTLKSAKVQVSNDEYIEPSPKVDSSMFYAEVSPPKNSKEANEKKLEMQAHKQSTSRTSIDSLKTLLQDTLKKEAGKKGKPSQKDDIKKQTLRRQVSGEEKERKQMLGDKLMNKFKGLITVKVSEHTEKDQPESSSEPLDAKNSAYDDDIYEEIEFTGGKKPVQNSALSSPGLPSLPPPIDFYEEVGSSNRLIPVQNSDTSSPTPPPIPLHKAVRAAPPHRSLPPLPHFSPPVSVPMSNPSHKEVNGQLAEEQSKL